MLLFNGYGVLVVTFVMQYLLTAKQEDNRFGSVCLSVHLFVCLSVLSRLNRLLECDTQFCQCLNPKIIVRQRNQGASIMIILLV